MRKFWTLAVSGAMTVGVAFGGLAVATTDHEGPTRVVEVEVSGISCPEEDTCYVDMDYRDGEWYARVWR